LFDKSSLSFGTQPYGFSSKNIVSLVNTSKINVEFVVSIPTKDKNCGQEFVIEPSKGTLNPRESKTIVVEFTPRRTGTYNSFIEVELVKVGKNVLSIPIYAESVVPHITISPTVLEYGNIFLNYSTKKTFELSNSTAYPARFWFHTQEESGKHVYSYVAGENSGIIGPHSVKKIDMSIE
jgi:hydrocephalus-inducing protein